MSVWFTDSHSLYLSHSECICLCCSFCLCGLFGCVMSWGMIYWLSLKLWIYCLNMFLFCLCPDLVVWFLRVWVCDLLTLSVYISHTLNLVPLFCLCPSLVVWFFGVLLTFSIYISLTLWIRCLCFFFFLCPSLVVWFFGVWVCDLLTHSLYISHTLNLLPVFLFFSRSLVF